MHDLYQIHYSPWSERARFALDACGVRYNRIEFIATLGEPALRHRLGRWRGKLSVPVFFPDGGPPLDDSFDIARWASEHSDTDLLPNADRDAIRGWNEVANRALEAGRILTTLAVREQPQALRESLPRPIQRLGPLGVWIGRDVTRRLLTKYATADASPDAHRHTMRQALLEIRAGLDDRDTLLQSFSYADITVAVGLQFVAPPAHPWIRLGPTSRPCWTQPALAEEFADLLAWRDRVYEQWRTRP